MPRLRSLEMVRAVAAVLVMLFHAQGFFRINNQPTFLWGGVSAGYRGVDLFFVLSGFVIAYAHATDLGRPGRLANYTFNRIVRIFPALWIMSLLALGMYAVGFGAADKADKLSPYSIVASFLLLPQHEPPLVNVSWTLTYEVFFYGLFALMLINLRVGLFLIVVWQAAVAVMALSGAEPTMSTYYLRSECLEFGVGLVCAWWVVKNGSVDRPALWWTLLAVGVVLFAGGMAADKTFAFAGALCALGAGGVILAVVQLEMAGRLRPPAVLVAIGSASYAIYLVHFSVLSIGSKVVARLGLTPGDGLGLLFIAAGLVCGFAFDRLIDKPIQRGLRTLKPRLLATDPRHASIPVVSARPGGTP